MNISKAWRISWPHLVLGVLGLAVSFYSVLVKQRIEAGGDSGCGFSDSINCDAVIGSNQWGTFLGLPWGVWGMAFFVIVLLTAINSASSTQTPRQEAGWRLAVATVGILTSVALTYISKFEIGAWCPVCMATHALTTLLFIISLVTYRRTATS